MRATIYYGCIIIGLFLCPFTGGAGMIAMCFFAYVLGKMMGDLFQAVQVYLGRLAQWDNVSLN